MLELHLDVRPERDRLLLHWYTEPADDAAERGQPRSFPITLDSAFDLELNGHHPFPTGSIDWHDNIANGSLRLSRQWHRTPPAQEGRGDVLSGLVVDGKRQPFERVVLQTHKDYSRAPRSLLRPLSQVEFLTLT